MSVISSECLSHDTPIHDTPLFQRIDVCILSQKCIVNIDEWHF